MDPATASIVVALIGLIGTILGLSIKEFKDMKNKNSADHGAVMLKLNKVQDSVDKVGERLDDHIDWHLKK
jgi:hypothetical protein